MSFLFTFQFAKLIVPYHPGVAELVPRHIWDVEIARSNRVTRTKNPLKSADFRGFCLS